MSRRGLAALAAVLFCALSALVTSASAVAPPFIIGPDGTTAPFSDYGAAIRQRVWVEVPDLPGAPPKVVDQDGDGVRDRVALDIIRPIQTDTGTKVPVIVYPSPYLTSIGVTSLGQVVHTQANTPDLFPGFYDNYFVPR